jgi:hypothetical protein
MIRRLLAWSLALSPAVHCALVLAYMALIFALSSTTIDPFASQGFLELVIVNLVHVPIYFGLSVLVGLLVRKLGPADDGGRPARIRAFLTVTVVLLYGASDEYHQSFTGRTPSAFDLASDLFGGILGVLALGYLLDNRPAAKVFWLSASLLAVLAVAIVVIGCL